MAAAAAAADAGKLSQFAAARVLARALCLVVAPCRYVSLTQCRTCVSVSARAVSMSVIVSSARLERGLFVPATSADSTTPGNPVIRR